MIYLNTADLRKASTRLDGLSADLRMSGSRVGSSTSLMSLPPSIAAQVANRCAGVDSHLRASARRLETISRDLARRRKLALDDQAENDWIAVAGVSRAVLKAMHGEIDQSFLRRFRKRPPPAMRHTATFKRWADVTLAALAAADGGSAAKVGRALLKFHTAAQALEDLNVYGRRMGITWRGGVLPVIRLGPGGKRITTGAASTHHRLDAGDADHVKHGRKQPPAIMKPFGRALSGAMLLLDVDELRRDRAKLFDHRGVADTAADSLNYVGQSAHVSADLWALTKWGAPVAGVSEGMGLAFDAAGSTVRYTDRFVRWVWP